MAEPPNEDKTNYMTYDDVSEWLEANAIGEVSCLVPDFGGTARGKSMTPALFLTGLKNGSLRLPEATYAVGAHGDFIFNDHIDRSERDLVLQCDLNTIHVTPWTKENAAAIICDGIRTDGTPFPLSPRQVLKDVLALYDKQGWKPIVGPEIEFYLIAPFEDIIRKPNAPRGSGGLREFGQYTYSLDAIDEFDEFFEDLYDFSKLQNIQLDTLIHEDGPCQFEVNLGHTDALTIADQLFLFKRLARHVGKKHGMFVTFMAKPYAEESGSSIHTHQSVVDTKTGKNIFANEDGSDSQLFSYYIGGLQKHLPEAMPFIAPYTNSYNRFEAYMSAPTNTHWGRENRTVGLRVPDSTPSARRIENRIAGSDINPYFAITASLICGYIGMMEKVEREEEFKGQSYDDNQNMLPGTLTNALDKFRKSDTLRKYLGDAVIDTFADVKQAEYDDRSSVLSPWDVQYLMVNI